MKDIRAEIIRLRLQRGWSEYELAKYSNISQSTISTWYRKKQVPTVSSIEKICGGLGITLSQFFAEGDDAIALTAEQRDLLDNWSSLTQKQRKAFLELFTHTDLEEKECTTI